MLLNQLNKGVVSLMRDGAKNCVESFGEKSTSFSSGSHTFSSGLFSGHISSIASLTYIYVGLAVLITNETAV